MDANKLILNLSEDVTERFPGSELKIMESISNEKKCEKAVIFIYSQKQTEEKKPFSMKGKIVLSPAFKIETEVIDSKEWDEKELQTELEKIKEHIAEHSYKWAMLWLSKNVQPYSEDIQHF